MSSQIVLLIAFLCITLLVASLVCLTLPGDNMNSTSDLWSDDFDLRMVSCPYSVHWALADVLLDRKL